MTVKLDASNLENGKSFLGMLCLVAAWMFPFYNGASRDALQQMFGLGMFGMASLLFGMSALSLLPTALFATVLLLIATAPSTYWGGHIAGVAGILLMGVALFVGAHLQRRPASLLWLLSAIVTAAVINAAEGLLQWIGLASSLWPWVVEPERRGIAFGVFRQPNLFATFLCVGVVCIVWLVHARRLTEAMAWFLLVMLVFAVAASASRSGGLELIALAIAGWLWRKQQSSTVTRLLVGPLLLFGLATLVLPIAAAWHGFEFIGSVARAANASEDSRFVLWRNALALIGERPWTGWGWLEMGYGHYITIFEPRFTEKLDHAHNLLLQVAIEFGLPVAFALFGTLFWLVCLGRPWRVNLPKSASEQNPVFSRQFAWAILMVIGIHSMLELPLWSAGFLFLTGLAIGFILPATSLATEPSRYCVWALRLASTSTLLLIVLACVAWQQYATVLQIYKAPFNDLVAQRRAVAKAEASNAWLFLGYLDFAVIGLVEVTPQNAFEVRQRAEKLLHFSAEPLVIQPLLMSLWYLNDTNALRFHVDRFCRAFPAAFQRWRRDSATNSINMDINDLLQGCPLRLP